MLQDKLKDWRIILGSGSPRRKELLKGLDIDFTIEYNPDIEEEIDPSLPFEAIPGALARQKSLGFPRPLASDELLITADTLVYCGNRILGKPGSREEACQMLRLLSGNVHTVLTAVYLRTANRSADFVAATEVTFRPLLSEEIEYYVDHYKPYDKAGAYGAQDWIGYIGIEHIKGSYFNVMGLPVQMLYKQLEQFLGE